MLIRASLVFGHFFKKEDTFQLSKDLKTGRGATTVFSILRLSGKVNHFYIFFYFHCIVIIHVPLCWQL